MRFFGLATIQWVLLGFVFQGAAQLRRRSAAGRRTRG
jgi:hypothetical protein